MVKKALNKNKTNLKPTQSKLGHDFVLKLLNCFRVDRPVLVNTAPRNHRPLTNTVPKAVRSKRQLSVKFSNIKLNSNKFNRSGTVRRVDGLQRTLCGVAESPKTGANTGRCHFKAVAAVSEKRNVIAGLQSASLQDRIAQHPHHNRDIWKQLRS
jgi:hypothetical protein